jgi:hypothetical protein
MLELANFAYAFKSSMTGLASLTVIGFLQGFD